MLIMTSVIYAHQNWYNAFEIYRQLKIMPGVGK